MQKQIYCKTVAQDKIAFYVQSAGKEFMLFTQRYYPSVWRYFAGGVDIHKVFDFNGRSNHAIQAVKQKLPAYIRYVENLISQNYNNFKRTFTKQSERNTVCNVAKKEAKQNIYQQPSTRQKRLLKKRKKFDAKIRCMPMLWKKPKTERYPKSVGNCKNKL